MTVVDQIEVGVDDGDTVAIAPGAAAVRPGARLDGMLYGNVLVAFGEHDNSVVIGTDKWLQSAVDHIRTVGITSRRSRGVKPALSCAAAPDRPHAGPCRRHGALDQRLRAWRRRRGCPSPRA